MADYAIENLEDLLKEHIGNDKKIVNTQIKRLTAPGENFGSIMLKVDVTLKNEADDAEEELHIVAKLIPTNEVLKEVFNVQVTVKCEIGFYDVIVPTLNQFLKEQGLEKVFDFFPKLYGARISLDENSDVVDEGAAIVLENVIVAGYHNEDRFKGFDIDTAKIVLKNLAAFHAVPLALKLKHPEIFEEKVKKYCKSFDPVPPPEESVKVLIEILQECDECMPFIPKVKKHLLGNKKFGADAAREPFSTLIHGDMWVNNIMIKCENGQPIDNKFVDFQVFEYNSPANDLFFFLWTSVQKRVLEESLDDLIKFYHDQFFQILTDLNCDTTPFTYQKFLEEVKASSVAEFKHTIFMMMFVVFGKKISKEVSEPTGPPDFDALRKNLTQEHKEKAWYVVRECGKRGWL